MNFLLKIVEGPNKGAEIALVEGVSVTLGKNDDCDIILADPTLPDKPVKLEATATGVIADGVALQPFQVRQAGSTAFAVGPADAPWGPLSWPSDETEPSAPPDKKDEKGEQAKEEQPAGQAADQANEEKKERKPFGCLFAVIVLLLLLLLLCWLFRGRIRPWVRSVLNGGPRIETTSNEPAPVSASFALETVAQRLGLAIEERDGRPVVSGNFATRAERLKATAEAYAAQPGVELDLSDDESLKAAVADTLSLIGEAGLSVKAVTNRVAVLSGKAVNLRRALKAVSAEVAKLENVDVAEVRAVQVVGNEGVIEVAAANAVAPSDEEDEPLEPPVVPKPDPVPQLPVCGILTTPYPCLVLRSGQRVMEGAPLGDSVVLKIEADAVTITNAAGRFTWKP